MNTMAINLKSLALFGLVAYLGYAYKDKIMSMLHGDSETKDAEYTHYMVDGVKVQDYGSLENPVSEEYAGIGKAVGQTGSEANEATLAMSVSGVGQNFNGRALGL
jgi:hypothetical protein|tara:strand:- start:22 stop:336 length:315 start_codon:yes stop_codon:yes gene_type:complete